MRWRREVGWRPRSLHWRIALLFMVGSTLFALGSFPPYSQLVDVGVVGTTFVVGSLFFTSAAVSQLLETMNEPETERAAGEFRWWAWQPRSLLWWAAIVQTIGTLFFNVNTVHATAQGLDAQEANRLVWAPDFFGSIAFLAASHLAWLAVCHRLWCVRRDDADWWVNALNYVGSIFFMASAICSYTLTTTGDVVNITIVNLGTFLGAVCFLVGAYLLLPPAQTRHGLLDTAPSTGGG